MNRILVHIRYIVEFIFIYIFYILFSLLPITLVSKIGGLIFKIIGPKTKLQKIVNKNLNQIFFKKNENLVKTQSKVNWSKIGKTFFELLVLNKIIKIKNKIIIKGKSNLSRIIDKKEKVIFVGIHQSNWEILLPTIDKIGIPVTGIYRHINNPYLNSLILKIRNKSITSKNSFYTPKGKKSAKDIIESIRNETSIVLLIDQKDSAGEIVPFFNFPAKTQIGFVKISRKYKLRRS